MSKEQLAENMRFYGDMRFKQLTVWLAGMTIFAAGSVQFADAELASNVTVREALAIAAPVFTGVIWIMEVSSTMYFVAHREIAPELWPQWKPRSPHPKWNARFRKTFTATNATSLLYFSTFMAWVWLGWNWGLPVIWLAILMVLAMALVTLTIINYVHLWKYDDAKSA